MNDINSMSRELKKRQLRSRVITPGEPQPRSQTQPPKEGGQEIVKQVHRKIVRRRLIILVLLGVLLAGFTGGFFWYQRYYQFENISVGWERQLEREGNFTAYETFGTNLLRYSKDGASYIDATGKDVWVQSYEMKSPIVAVNGNYAAIADQQGNNIYICDLNGCQGVATTVLPIIKVTVSAKGVVAAILEDQTASASYIYFYRKDGTEIKLFIKGVLGGNIGYPLDISLSPDGTILIGSYAFIEGGTLKNRVAFYNFSEVGKNALNRFVGGFHDIYENSMVPRVRYLNDTYAVAFADNSISFYTSADVMSPALVTQVPVEEEIKSVFCSDKYAGIIVKSVSGEYDSRMDLYGANGEKLFDIDFTYVYEHVDIDEDFIFLYNENSCKIYNSHGVLKYEGEFDFTVSKINKGSQPNQIIVAGPQVIKEIRLH